MIIIDDLLSKGKQIVADGQVVLTLTSA